MIYLIILAILVTGCVNASEDKELAACGSFAVPGMFCYDLKGGSFSCEVLERDNYGRILFLYETTSCITNNREKAYVICQRLEASYVCFYEDVCYMYATDSADLSTLKTANDWDKPLNKEQMAKRNYKISADLFLVTNSKQELSRVKLACCETFHIKEKQIKSLILLDLNEDAQALYWFATEENEEYKTYCLIVDSEYALEYTNIEMDDSYWEKIQEFKQTANWQKSGDGSLS